MYLAMSRVAYRGRLSRDREYWRRAAFEEAEHAAKFAELLGDGGHRLHQEEPGDAGGG
ncbi:MAG: hypothetical protein ACLR1T_09715 [Evtepia gabavorous]